MSKVMACVKDVFFAAERSPATTLMISWVLRLKFPVTVASIKEGTASHQVTTANTSLQSILETKAHVTIYTNGSATSGTATGSAAMEATVGDPVGPVIIHTPKIRGAELTFSYEEEKATPLWLSTGQGPTTPLSA